MAMNIGEIRHGSFTFFNNDSTFEITLNWYAKRTSATTTTITTDGTARLIGEPSVTGNAASLYVGIKTYVNGITEPSGKGRRLQWKGLINSMLPYNKVFPIPEYTITITHEASGIESFTFSAEGVTFYGSKQYLVNFSLAQRTINLSEAAIVRIVEGTIVSDEFYNLNLRAICSFNQSISENYTEVTTKLQLGAIHNANTGGMSGQLSDWSGDLTVNGSKKSYSFEGFMGMNYISGVLVDINTVLSSSTYVKSYIPVTTSTTKVYHDDEGKKNIAISGSVKIEPETYSHLYRATLSSTTISIPDIPRAATLLTAPNFTDEDNPTITYSNPAGSAVTTLQAAISLDGTSAAIGWKDVSKTGVSYTFNLTDDERNTLRAAAANAATMQVAFLLKTVIGSNTFTESAQRTLTIVSCNPLLDSTVIDTNATTVALTGDSNKLVKFYSNAQASLNVTLQKGSTLAYYEIKNGSNYGNAQVFTFNNVENNKFEFLARDSRGNIATKTVTPTMVEYIKLTCNLGSNTPDTSGNYDIRVTGNYFNGSFGAVSNTLTVQYRYKTESGSYGSWVTMTNSLSSGTYEATARITGLDYRAAYVVQVRATDKITTITSDERKVQTLPVFSWSDEDFEFNTDVRVTGDLRLKGDGNYGNTLYFGDGSYAFIREATDDDLFLHASDLTLEATNIYLQPSGQLQINGSTLPAMETGTWDAVLGSSAAVKSYTSRQGWYIKIGNVVTIGWNVDVTCNSGYQSTAIKIAGAPYFPSVSAAGGGILYGAYTTGGLAFEGWVIEESGGAITPRLQPCNNTAAANLNISSTAYYPNGGGNLKCFGTITYTTND